MTRLIVQTDHNDTKIELYEKEGGTEEIFAEGIHGIAIMGTHVKFNLFSTCPWSGTRDEYERRQAAVTITMPLPQFCDVATLLYNKVEELKKAGILIEENPLDPKENS